MRRRRFRWGPRALTLAVAAILIALALLIFWFGYRFDRATDRFVAEGRLAQGRYLYTDEGSCSGDSCDNDTIHVAYTVGGATYRTYMSVARTSGSPPIFGNRLIRVPRLGPERPYQVVYLPSDPSRSRLRADLVRAHAAFYGTSGMFLFVGLVFGAFGLFVLPRR